MKKLLKQALSINLLRKTLGWEIFGQAIKSNLHFQIIDNPQNLLAPTTDKIKVLVLSPHADDDVFAIGGSLHMHSKNGDIITVLYFCDGSKGTPEGIRDSSLITKRKKEAQDAAKIIGINEMIFWGYKDGMLTSNATSIKGLANLIDEIKPHIIYLPSILDNHPDHLAVNDIFYKSIAIDTKLEKHTAKVIAMYELWTPIFPNRIVNITDSINNKRDAIACHQSQLKSRNYDKAMIGLSQYRAETCGIKGYGEALFACNLKIYKKLYEILEI